MRGELATPGEFEVLGTNAAALFSLKVHRGDGMVLFGMDWRNGMPPPDFVGFSMEYMPRGHTTFLEIANRLGFATLPANVGSKPRSSLFAPIQKFRWVHFPFDPQPTPGKSPWWLDAWTVPVRIRDRKLFS
jgi:hypothetical protein